MLPKLRGIYAKWDILLFVTILLFIILIRYNAEISDARESSLIARKGENGSLGLARHTGVALAGGCQGSKKQKIVFLKTHKCASSSLQNIFFRFGEKYELNFVLPFHGGHQLYGRANRFSQSLLGPKANHLDYSILCLHTRWNYHEMEKVMGEGEKTTYITMLRDPVDVFESQWVYYGHEKLYKMTIDEFAAGGNITDRKIDRRIGKNQMLWDLGLDEVDDEELVRKKIEDIEDKFNLVMILENFEESLILMRHTLCWDHSDITSLKLNARKSENSTMKESTRLLLRDLLRSDYLLYNHFSAIFHQKMKDFGDEEMKEELKKLDEANNQVAQKCEIGLTENKYLRGDARWWGPGLMGYKVDNDKEECKLLAMSEMSYVERVRRIQVKRENEK